MPLLSYFRATLNQLLRPFKYLSIRHPSKKIIDWIIPFLSVFVLFTFVILGKYFNVYLLDKSNLLSKLNSFLHVLPGFYIAALAAVATFGSSAMDSLISSPTPTIQEVRVGVLTEIGLTRRRFLSMLFSFLTAQSVLLIVFYNVLSSISLNGEFFYFNCLPDVLFALYMIIFFQIIAVTFFGLFYLGDRIHKD